MMRQDGPAQASCGMIPGLGKQLQGVDVDERELERVEAIVLSMTAATSAAVPRSSTGRAAPRIARGSGTTVQQVNQLLNARKQMAEDDEADGQGQDAHVQSIAAAQRQVARTSEGDEWQLRIRLTRVGSKKNPIYRVVVADSRSPRDGKFIEIVGRYNPQTDPSTIELDEAKIKDWLAKGAQPTDPVKRLMKAKDIPERRAAVDARARRSTSRGASSTSPDAGPRRARSSGTTRSCCGSTCAEDDLGKVIGRQGRIARALRTLVRASGAARSDERALLEIVDVSDGRRRAG